MIVDFDRGLGLGIEIGDWGLGIGNWDCWDSGLGIEDWDWELGWNWGLGSWIGD